MHEARGPRLASPHLKSKKCDGFITSSWEGERHRYREDVRGQRGADWRARRKVSRKRRAGRNKEINGIWSKQKEKRLPAEKKKQKKTLILWEGFLRELAHGSRLISCSMSLKLFLHRLRFSALSFTASLPIGIFFSHTHTQKVSDRAKDRKAHGTKKREVSADGKEGSREEGGPRSHYHVFLFEDRTGSVNRRSRWTQLVPRTHTNTHTHTPKCYSYTLQQTEVMGEELYTVWPRWWKVGYKEQREHTHTHGTVRLVPGLMYSMQVGVFDHVSIMGPVHLH